MYFGLMRSATCTVSALLVSLLLFGCGTTGGYQSLIPPRPVTPSATTATDIAPGDEKVVHVERFADASERFPAQIAVARVVPRSEHRGSHMCHAQSRYCLVASRDIESQEQYSRLVSLPGIAGMRMLTPLIVTGQIADMDDLRGAAGRIHADMLLVYTLHRQEDVSIGRSWPLDLASLGLLPSQQNNLVVTAAATLYDTRTGYVYGTLESAARADLRTSVWNAGQVDVSRLAALEREAFATLVERFEMLWGNVMHAYAAK